MTYCLQVFSMHQIILFVLYMSQSTQNRSFSSLLHMWLSRCRLQSAIVPLWKTFHSILVVQMCSVLCTCSVTCVCRVAVILCHRVDRVSVHCTVHTTVYKLHCTLLYKTAFSDNRFSDLPIAYRVWALRLLPALFIKDHEQLNLFRLQREKSLL